MFNPMLKQLGPLEKRKLFLLDLVNLFHHLLSHPCSVLLGMHALSNALFCCHAMFNSYSLYKPGLCMFFILCYSFMVYLQFKKLLLLHIIISLQNTITWKNKGLWFRVAFSLFFWHHNIVKYKFAGNDVAYSEIN